MARHHKGILQEFSGKVGTVVGGNWKGIPYIRSLPRTGSVQPSSRLQLDRQARFALGMRVVQAMGKLTTCCFQVGEGKTSKNEALSRVLSQAVYGIYPDLKIEYNQLEVARGQLKKAEQVTVSASGAGQLRFNWHNNTGTGNAAADDQAVLVACVPDTMDMMYSLEGGSRAAGMGLLDVRFFTGRLVHTWISFQSKGGGRIADSVYVGELVAG